MNWINIEAAQLRSPDVNGCPPAALGTWLRVLAYCCEMENGGRIPGAATWNDRQWMTSCGATFNEVKEAAGLVTVEGDDVIVSMYPTVKQAEVEAKRKAGSKGGNTKWHGAGSSSANSSADSSANGSAYTEEKRREGKRRGKGKGNKDREREPQAQTRSPSSAPCTENEAVFFAFTLPQTPPWTEQAVEKWYSTRAATRWIRGGATPTPITADTWRDDLRASHGWATRANGKPGASGPHGSTDSASVTDENRWAEDHLAPTERTR